MDLLVLFREGKLKQFTPVEAALISFIASFALVENKQYFKSTNRKYALFCVYTYICVRVRTGDFCPLKLQTPLHSNLNSSVMQLLQFHCSLELKLDQYRVLSTPQGSPGFCRI